MAEHETSPRGFRRFRLLLAVLFALVVLLFAIALFLRNKPSPVAAALDAKLAQLRAEGVPLSPEELAKVFPDPSPEHDGRIVLRDALAWAPRGNASPLLPIVGGAMPLRSERISDPVMQAFAAHLSNSDAILAAIPAPLTNVWFSTGWAQGLSTPLQVPVTDIRALNQTLALKALHEAELGNSAKAAEALQKGFGVAATLRGDSLLSTMMRVACALIMCEPAEQTLNRTKFNDQQLASIAASVPLDIIDDFDNALTVERTLTAHFLGQLRQVHNSINRDRVRLAWWRLMNMFSRSKKPLYRDEDYFLFLNTVDEIRGLGSKALLDRMREMERISAHFKTNAQSTAATMFFPNLTKATHNACEAKARLAALQTALAIERFRLANSDALPPSLDVLVPKYCSAAPLDPFDEQPMRYKKLTRGYVVYSIGADGVDGGGTERIDAKQRSGYDVTITVER